LLDRGANINARGYNGNSALHFAAANGRLEVVQYLIEKGADKEAKNSNGHKAVDLANYGGYREVVNLLTT